MPKKSPKKKSRMKPALPPKTSGFIVTGTDPCVCGHAPEEHGRDPKYPGSTSCTECECIAYEAEGSSDDGSN